MTTFDDRERAFENLFAHDLELSFRAHARRNHEIGLWAARHLGRTGEAAEDYAVQILKASIEEGGTEAVVGRLQADFRERGLSISDHQIRRRMDELLAKATEEVRAS